MTNGSREAAAVARLQDRRLDLEEALPVEVGADAATIRLRSEEVRARLLVHQQVEVALAVARLDVGEAVEGVGQRRADLREQLELVDRSDGSPRRDFAGCPLTPTMSPRSTSTLLGEQLDPPAAVDEVEERELPHLAARHHPAGEPERLRLVRRARLELLGLGPDRSDLVPVGKALRQHRAISR